MRNLRWSRQPSKLSGVLFRFSDILDGLKLPILPGQTFFRKSTLIRNFWTKNERDVLNFYQISFVEDFMKWSGQVGFEAA